MTTTKRIQEADLRILKNVLPLFEKYQLRYYMLGGTLLGAVRHQGFIPWDDDIDIGMPRPDYERFLTIAEKELKEPFRLLTFQNGRRASGVYFSQVADESVEIRRVNAGNAVRFPVWIDVFPLDGVPEGKLRFALWRRRCLLLSKLFSLSQVEKLYDVSGGAEAFRTKKERFIYLFLRLRLQKLLRPERLWDKLDRALKRYDYDSASRIINFCGYWRLKELFSKSVYGEGKLYPFEDLMLWGPEDADFVLTQMYGDYMTPPPDAEKYHHNIEVIEGERQE